MTWSGRHFVLSCLLGVGVAGLHYAVFLVAQPYSLIPYYYGLAGLCIGIRVPRGFPGATAGVSLSLLLPMQLAGNTGFACRALYTVFALAPIAAAGAGEMIGAAILVFRPRRRKEAHQ
jgi:hypothetical protein